MTEAEWLGCDDPQPMLRYLLGLRPDECRVQDIETFPSCRASDRKLRLFACACYHRVRHLIPDLRAAAAIEVAERVAEGSVPVEERQWAEANVREPIDNLEGRWRASTGAERIALHPTHAALALGLVALWKEAQKAAYYASSNAYYTVDVLANPGATSYERKTSEKQVQTSILRDIFGNPFHPVTIDPQHVTAPVTALAQAIYAERAFDRLPILADALEDAGCTNLEVLQHCRNGGEHVRGCWVVDLLLGRE